MEDLIQKGYIDVNVRSRLRPKEPALSMAHLLDKAFPKLPGLALVAYFIQMIDELYEHKGLDKNGIPKQETLKDLGLENEPSHLI